jgi:hypothetical protein
MAGVLLSPAVRLFAPQRLPGPHQDARVISVGTGRAASTFCAAAWKTSTA